MKFLYKLSVLLTVASILPVQQPSVTFSQNTSPDSEDKKVCVIRNVVKPSAVWFKNSITLTQAIEGAGGVPLDSKSNQVIISRRLEGGKMMIIRVDLKAIQKGRAKDLPLENNDIVDVVTKDKKKEVSVTESDCSLCGCKIRSMGTHRSIIIP